MPWIPAQPRKWRNIDCTERMPGTQDSVWVAECANKATHVCETTPPCRDLRRHMPDLCPKQVTVIVSGSDFDRIGPNSATSGQTLGHFGDKTCRNSRRSEATRGPHRPKVGKACSKDWRQNCPNRFWLGVSREVVPRPRCLQRSRYFGSWAGLGPRPLRGPKHRLRQSPRRMRRVSSDPEP